MKRKICLFCLFLIVSFLFFSSAYDSDLYLYWYGKLESSSVSQCYAYSFDTKTIYPLGIEGYCIEGDGDSALFALPSKESLSEADLAWMHGNPYPIRAHRTNVVEIAQFIGAERGEDLRIEFPEDIYRVYAVKQCWAYYSYSHGDDDIGIRRVNPQGEVQNYSLYPYIQTISDLMDLVYSVSDDGTIAFLSVCYAKGWPNQDTEIETSRICMCRPNGSAFMIESVGQAKCLHWVDTDKLFYLALPSYSVSFLNVSADGNGQYTASAESMPITLKGITRLALSGDGTCLAYQRRDGFAMPVYSRWQKIELFPLDDPSTQIKTQQVYIEYQFGQWPPFQLLP